MKKGIIIGAAAVVVLGIGGVAAMQNPDIMEMAGLAQVTPESLVDGAFKENPDGVMDVDMSVQLDAEMDTSDLGMDGTMEFDIGFDMNIKSNKECAFADGDAKIKLLGMNQKIDIKSYYDKEEGTTYSYNGNDKKWEYERDEDGEDIGSKVSSIGDKIDSGILKDMELKEHKRGEDYEVTARIDADSIKDLVDNTNMDSSDIGFNGMLESLNDADADMEVNMSFDGKTKEIKSIAMDMDFEAEDVPGNLSVEFKFNQIGGELDLSVPDDVKEFAIEKEDGSSTLLPDTDSAGMEDTDNMEGASSQEYNFDSMYGGSSTGTSDSSMPEGSDNQPFGQGQQTDIQQPQQQDQQALGQQTSKNFGSYNGKQFGIGFPLSDFTNDGWQKASYGSDSGIFISYENAKYPQAELALYGDKSTITESDLAQKGAYGYKADVTYCEAGTPLPQMAFGGLTWGASKEDIISVYGQPEDTMSGPDGVVTLYYTGSDGTEMNFKVNESYDTYAKNPIHGLVAVQVVNFSTM